MRRDFQVNDRVCLNEWGRDASPRRAHLIGTVLRPPVPRGSGSAGVLVLWDGRKTPVRFAACFLELAPVFVAAPLEPER